MVSTGAPARGGRCARRRRAARAGCSLLTPGQEDELRAFCSLVARRMSDGEQARLGAGAASSSAASGRAGLEALSDNLLALRALLEHEDGPPGLLARRLSALCAAPEEAPELAARIEEAIALERSVRLGAAHPGAHGEQLAREVAEHLRALLRDVICGHLPERLGELADSIISEAAASLEPAVPIEDAAPSALPEALEQQLLREPFAAARTTAEEPDGETSEGETSPGYAPLSLEEIFGHAAQSEEILDVLV